MKRISITLILLSLSGCGLFSSKNEDTKQSVMMAAEPPKTETRSLASTAPPKRELGSLWSEDSKWSEFYSVRMSRGVGDVIILRPSDSFKVDVASKGGKSYDPTQMTRENSNVVVQIREVVARGVYSVEAAQNLRVGAKDHRIRVAGKLREADIGIDDSGSTDNLFDLKLEVENPNHEIEKKMVMLNKDKPESKDKEKDKDKEEGEKSAAAEKEAKK